MAARLEFHFRVSLLLYWWSWIRVVQWFLTDKIELQHIGRQNQPFFKFPFSEMGLCLIWNMGGNIALQTGLNAMRCLSEGVGFGQLGTYRWGNRLPLSRQGAGCVLGAHGQGGHLLLSSSGGPATGFGWVCFHHGSSFTAAIPRTETDALVTHRWANDWNSWKQTRFISKQCPGCVCVCKSSRWLSDLLQTVKQPGAVGCFRFSFI